jgi:hypothetical protein
MFQTFKLVFFVLILISSLFSNILCRKKINHELIILPNGYPAWVADANHVLTFNPNLIEDLNITKRNPLLGLYLIEVNLTNIKFEPMLFRKIRSPLRFAIDDETYVPGKIKKQQIGLNFAEFSEMIEDNLMIISGCCVTAGLSIGGNKYIEADYLKHFIESDDKYLSDIGARFKEVDGKIIVDEVNPFFTDNPFLEGDEILYFNDEPVSNLADFMKQILFVKKDTQVKIEVLRNNELFEFKIKTAILRGGGFLSDTFLENIGVWFDKNLNVTNVHAGSAFAKKHLKNHYHLISINDQTFKNEKEIRQFLSKIKNHIPDFFTFKFRLQDKELEIKLKSNKKYFKNIEKTDKFAVEGAENNSFNIGSFGNNFGFNTGSFSFSGNWNGETSSYEINNSFYDIYNSIPLAEYLSY